VLACEELSNQRVSYIETNLGQICIRRSGQGNPMIFWPSLMMDGTMWNCPCAVIVNFNSFPARELDDLSA